MFQYRYSTDEGETWDVHEFSKVKLRIYGILTEPGEKTTVFSLFGSQVEEHSWMLIQVNLSVIFSKYYFNYGSCLFCHSFM